MTRRQLALTAAAAVVALLLGMVVRGATTAEAPPPAPASERAPEIARPVASTTARPADVHSQEGARLAAIDHVTASQRWLYLSDDELDSAVRGVAAPASADRLAAEVLAEVGAAREALTASPGRVWWLVRPLAWKVRSYTGSSARVAVWTVTVLSAADVAVPQADWLTVTVDLAWSGDGWLVEAVSDVLGPTPLGATRDEPWQPEPFDEALDGFARIDGEDLAGELS